MFDTVLNKFTKRLVLTIILALIGGILLEVVLKLQYRNYTMFQSVNYYLFAICLSILFMEIAYQIDKRLNSLSSFEDKPVKRMVIQSAIYIILGLIIFVGIRLSYVLLFSTKKFILFSHEMTISTLIICVILVFSIVDFGVKLINQWRYSLAQAEKYKKESAEFEFEMLQAQINPHFLFNSLNTLSSLVYQDADRSADFIRKLSDVYRHVLDARQKDLISIREEVSFIESFIFLLELRFDKKLKIILSIDDHIMDRKIAPLTLQLLIENAVKHNIVSDKKPLKVKVYNDDHFLIVENPLQLKLEKEKGNQMGLNNISSRYKALCDKDIMISDDDRKFTVKVPII